MFILSPRFSWLLRRELRRTRRGFTRLPGRPPALCLRKAYRRLSLHHFTAFFILHHLPSSPLPHPFTRLHDFAGHFQNEGETGEGTLKCFKCHLVTFYTSAKRLSQVWQSLCQVHTRQSKGHLRRMLLDRDDQNQRRASSIISNQSCYRQNIKTCLHLFQTQA